MAKEKLIAIKEAELTNNCPECFNQELKLTFYQKHRYGKLFHRTTNEVTNQIVCRKCSSMIYPVKWTDDIERIFNYYQKMVQPEKSSLKFTSLFYILLLLLIALIAGGVYVFLEGTIQL
ncbi:hypothetical protein [Costertonia aggregata]|uniref:Uncharacterized protein n=1 Tax=Costertonia aggregata TaxID=343403 RepID=A0A7H9AQC6_9FLAO|nr:hypothetical protein [Costertonia aggregata]QLG45648.1 hypothetical protein HYG79_09915 [Costertonia aggregata]